MKMSLYLTDDLFFFEEQIKEWRKEFSDVTIVTELSASNMQSTPTLFGDTLTVIKQDKLPAAKKTDAVIKMVSDRLDVDNVVLFFTAATRTDRTGALAKVFPEGRVVGMYSMTGDQKEAYLYKQLPWLPTVCLFDAVEAAAGMDTRTFRSKVLQLAAIHASEADLAKEFPKQTKGAAFTVVPLAEQGTPETLAKALAAVRTCRLNGDEPMMLLGAMHRCYRLSYKLAIAPNGRKAAAKELGLSGYQLNSIPELSADVAKRRHRMVADAVTSIKSGRDGYEAVSALVSKISAAVEGGSR